MLNHPRFKRVAARLVPLMPHWLYELLLRFTQAHFLVGVTGFVFNSQGQMLLLHHVFRHRFPWGPPGGWLKNGEDPIKALVRELYEETGLIIAVHRPLYVQEKDGHLEIIYLATTEGGEVKLSGEILEAAFFDPHNLPHKLRLYHEKVLPWAIEEWQALGRDMKRPINGGLSEI